LCIYCIVCYSCKYCIFLSYIIIIKTYLNAIHTYNRSDVISNKTLKTLYEGNITKNKIYIFVANQKEYDLYKKNVLPQLYNKIVIGKKGITQQRNVIANYFPEGQYVISMDDDIESLEILKGDKLVKLKNINDFFTDAYKLLKKNNLYIWGIYPVRNPFFMYKETSYDLRFIIGLLFGFITRHNSKLKMSSKLEMKEDYEQSILYFKMDGGVIRFNNITAKTKFNSEGGLGSDRYERNKLASEYLYKKYPDIISIFQRKNKMYEVKLKRLPRILS
jgi:hypothetical protein